jgi:predicted phage terminase large subunit-like protein
MKSLSVCVFWPVWEWGPGQSPSTKWIYGSYGARLSQRDAIRHRNLIDSPWFKCRWPGIHIPYQNTRSAMDFANNRGGWRFSTTVKGGVTGRHANRLVVDDPTKPQDAMGSRAAMATELDNVIDWHDGTLSTRQADPKTTTETVIMQRLHERDLAGHLLKTDHGYTHLRLPMEYEPKFHCVTGIGEDKRTEDGELLWPDRYPRAEVDRLKTQLGSRGTASQLQQRPSPAGGAIFRKEWFRYWGAPGCPFEAIPKRHTKIQSWDFTFKGAPIKATKRSFVAGQLWAHAAGNYFLIAQERGQWAFVESVQALLRLSSAWPDARKKLIEDAANGAAIHNACQNRVSGMVLVPTGGGSEARAEAVSPLLESGNVYLPHKSIAPWIVDLEAEWLAFPNGANDDQVDCGTHALVHMSAGAGTLKLYRDAMAQLTG